jgi:hypothetical protein
MEHTFLSEYTQGKRTAHVFKKTDEYVVYCFCCDQEHMHGGFNTEFAAEDWAENWVQKQVELPELVDSTGCDCH